MDLLSYRSDICLRDTVNPWWNRCDLSQGFGRLLENNGRKTNLGCINLTEAASRVLNLSAGIILSYVRICLQGSLTFLTICEKCLDTRSSFYINCHTDLVIAHMSDDGRATMERNKAYSGMSKQRTRKSSL